jgi:hypothetical protein
MRVVKRRPRLREVVVEQRRHVIVRPFEAFQHIEYTAALHNATADHRTLTQPSGERIASTGGARVYHQMGAQGGREQAQRQQHGQPERLRMFGHEAVAHPDAEQDRRQIDHAGTRMHDPLRNKPAARDAPGRRRDSKEQRADKYRDIHLDARPLPAGRRRQIAREATQHRGHPYAAAA